MSETSNVVLGSLICTNSPVTYGIVQPGPNVSPDGVPLIRGKDYSSGVVSTEGLYHVLDEIDRPYSRSKVKEGDLLISIVGYVGQVAVVPKELEGANITQTTARLRVDFDKAFPKYVYHCLESETFKKEVKRYEKGSAQPGLNLCDVEKLRVGLINDIKSQKKISEILDSIDGAINKTGCLIKKYQQIKTGLMHDLFTRGVTADGQLRPLREQAPELYKETALGWIPIQWEVVEIEDVASVIDPNPSHRNPIYHDEGFPFISTVEFIESDEIEIDTPRRVIEEIVNEQERRCKFSANSIAFSRKGTIAEIRFLPSNVRFALLDSLCVINPLSIDPDFLFHSLRSDYLKLQIRFLTMGQALPQMSIGRVRSLAIPCPKDNDEQNEIARRLGAVTNYINYNFDQLRKFKQQKFGLMEDLLTGKVQVKVDQ